MGRLKKLIDAALALSATVVPAAAVILFLRQVGDAFTTSEEQREIESLKRELANAVSVILKSSDFAFGRVELQGSIYGLHEFADHLTFNVSSLTDISDDVVQIHFGTLVFDTNYVVRIDEGPWTVTNKSLDSFTVKRSCNADPSEGFYFVVYRAAPA